MKTLSKSGKKMSKVSKFENGKNLKLFAFWEDDEIAKMQSPEIAEKF